MKCQAVPLQSQSIFSNHPDHDPPSRPDATPVLSHRPPPPTRTNHEPPPRSWSTACDQCQRDTGSATSTTISMTQNPPHWIQHRDPRCAIHKPQSMVRPQRPWICGVLCAVGDALLVTAVAVALVVNGCVQRCSCFLDGLCWQPWQKATHQKTELDPKPGNPFEMQNSTAASG
ncbi:unnamed protein product [Pleuronectes platessa]|uniref:Uncharacterized protein n=1 Tax=Pleuronectes platessa TaxID=8262 RepID=A0A9N7VRE2_PLEPL|nr:unnamed protein product [Pleuronectes platessa]